MILDGQHPIIGVKLITMHGAELELRAGNDWRLAIWDENDRPESGREIGPSGLIAQGDPDFRLGGTS
ncbi:MAG: hypothetical protein U1E64_00230 [Sphingomonadaceae bacterium]